MRVTIHFKLVSLVIILVILLSTVALACTSKPPAQTSQPSAAPATTTTTTPPKPSATQAAAPAGPVFNLKLTTWSPPSSGVVPIGIQKFVDEVKKQTANRVNIEVFWAEALAKAKETSDAVRLGTADMGTVPSAYYTDLFPLVARPSYEYFHILNPSYGESLAAYRKMVQKYPSVFEKEFKAQNQKLLMVFEMGPMGFVSKKPVKTVEDIKGMKVAVSGSAFKVKPFQVAQATIVSIPAQEAYEAFSKGLIDGDYVAIEGSDRYKFHEVAHYYIDPGFGTAVQWITTVNLDTWNKIPPDLQQTVAKVATDVEYQYPIMTRDGENAYKEKQKAAGTMEVLKFSDAEHDKWVNLLGTQFFDDNIGGLEKLGIANAKQIMTEWRQLFIK